MLCHLNVQNDTCCFNNSITASLMTAWWRHQMETFPSYWPFEQGFHRSPVNSPHKGQWRRALTFSLICAWINGWVNNNEAGDWRRHRTRYDVSVMTIQSLYSLNGRTPQGFMKSRSREIRGLDCYNSSKIWQEPRLQCFGTNSRSTGDSRRHDSHVAP